MVILVLLVARAGDAGDPLKFGDASLLLLSTRIIPLPPDPELPLPLFPPPLPTLLREEEGPNSPPPPPSPPPRAPFKPPLESPAR